MKVYAALALVLMMAVVTAAIADIVLVDTFVDTTFTTATADPALLVADGPDQSFSGLTLSGTNIDTTFTTAVPDPLILGGTAGCVSDGSGTGAFDYTSVGQSWDAAACAGYDGQTLTVTAGADDLQGVEITVPASWTLTNTDGVTVASPQDASTIDGTGSPVTSIDITFDPVLSAGSSVEILIGGALTAPGVDGATTWTIKTKGVGQDCAFADISSSPTVTVEAQGVSGVTVDIAWQSVEINAGGTASSANAYIWGCEDLCGSTVACTVSKSITTPCASVSYNSGTDKVDIDDTGTAAVGGLCSLIGSSNSFEATSELVVYETGDQSTDGTPTDGEVSTLNGVDVTPDTTGGTLYVTDIVDPSFPGEASCGPWDFYHESGSGITIAKAGCVSTCYVKLNGVWTYDEDCVFAASGVGGGFGGPTSGGQVYTAPAFDALALAVLLGIGLFLAVFFLSKKR